MAAPAPVREPCLSLADASAELGITVPTLRDWIWRRKIGSFRLGHVRIPVSEIQRVKRAAWRPPALGRG
jgi:hypothetical protein